MEFEWDPSKNSRNVVLHGIAIEDASAVFNDPYRLGVAREEGGRRAAIVARRRSDRSGDRRRLHPARRPGQADLGAEGEEG
jgi:uncharacterized DUF497 family protein